MADSCALLACLIRSLSPAPRLKIYHSRTVAAFLPRHGGIGGRRRSFPLRCKLRLLRCHLTCAFCYSLAMHQGLDLGGTTWTKKSRQPALSPSRRTNSRPEDSTRTMFQSSPCANGQGRHAESTHSVVTRQYGIRRRTSSARVCGRRNGQIR